MTDNEVRILMDKVEKMLASQAAMRADIRAIRDENDKADIVHADHENRIRGLEQIGWKVAGAWAVLGSGAGAGIFALFTH